MKICSECRVQKTDTEFFRDKNRKSGLTPSCKQCQKDHMARPETQVRIKAYRKKRWKEDKPKWQQEKRLRTYGLTEEGYQKLLKDQDYRCAICRDDDPKHKTGQWQVDHDHRTGLIRGLLCSPCNLSLGGFRDNPDIVQSAFNYLKRSR